jgi:hypothetical protein
MKFDKLAINTENSRLSSVYEIWPDLAIIEKVQSMMDSYKNWYWQRMQNPNANEKLLNIKPTIKKNHNDFFYVKDHNYIIWLSTCYFSNQRP